MYLRIHKTDRTTDAALRAFDAEERFFESCGLSYVDRDVDVSGLRVRVLEIGEGRPVVVLPGLTGAAWPMAPLVKHLQDRRVLLVNLPGAGLSDGLDFRNVSVRQLALEVTRAVFGRFSIDRAEMIASGIGGAWALWFAIEYPRQVPVITQLGTPAFIEGMTVSRRLRLLSTPILNRILLSRFLPQTPEAVRSLAGSLGHSPASAVLTDLAVECGLAFAAVPSAQSSWLNLLESTLTPGGLRSRSTIQLDELRHVKAPVQFIWGQHDPFAGEGLAGNVVVAVPSAILHETPGGHLPWWDEPEQCASWVLAFHEEVLSEAGDSGVLREPEPPADYGFPVVGAASETGGVIETGDARI